VGLVNARDAKHVPGRKTDVSDAQWLRRLHEYGLLRGSFRPKGELAALRAYLRQRERLLDYSASHIQHMQKALMQMNVQLHHVVTDVTGETGMRIVRAVVAGERDPAVLATHRDRRCHASEKEIAAALAGNWREEHVFALGQALELYDAYHTKVVECDLRIECPATSSRRRSDIGGQRAFDANAAIRQQSRGSAEAGRSDRRSHADGDGRLLSTAVRTRRQGQSGDRNGSKDRHPVLQHTATWDRLR
jgi:hypothetical protein